MFFETLDWIVVGIYFLLIFAIAFVVMQKRDTTNTASGYFLAGRNVGWVVIGASLFASNIGSEHLVGLAGTGAKSGVAMAQFEILASLILLLLGWVFVPFYLRSGVYTMPEFLERRYDSRARWYLAMISIIGYVLTKISVTIAAGGIVFQSLMGIDFWVGAFVVVSATGLYTIIGGLRAVLYTDLMQAVVLIAGSVAVTVASLVELGGWSEIEATVGPQFLNMWKPASDPDFPWTGILLGAPIIGVWYWCTDQFIVQRVLSARNIHEARKGTIFAALLKVLPVFIFVLPGVVAAALAKRGDIELTDPDAALTTLIGNFLPVGLRGLVGAGLLAALMSSLSSVFNSCSTLVTWDIYRKIRPDATDRQLVIVGQGATILLVAFGLAWIPLMDQISTSLYEYLQKTQAYIAPPVAAVFLLGVFWKRANGRGAIAAMVVGFVLGIGRLLTEINRDALSGPLRHYADINFLHFAALLFVVCSVVLVVVSFGGRPASEEKLRGLTFATLPDGPDADGPAGRGQIGWTIVALVLVGGVWLFFSR